MKQNDQVIDSIKESFIRNRKALELKPSLGKKTAVTNIKMIEGLKCSIKDAEWEIIADFNDKKGGTNAGPNPGILARGAFGSCLLMGYVMWSSYLGINIKNIEIRVESDFDARGEYGIDGIKPGYNNLRYYVNIESDADEKEILEMVYMTENASSLLDLFISGTEVERRINITKPSEVKV